MVEDERPLFEAIKMKIEKSNFSVVVARSVAQAMSYIEDLEKIDAVWLDHYLFGKEDGLDFVAKLKGHATWKQIPIFVVSNTASPEKVQSYLRLGINKYYVKAEHRLDEIIEDIKSFLRHPEE